MSYLLIVETYTDETASLNCHLCGQSLFGQRDSITGGGKLWDTVVASDDLVAAIQQHQDKCRGSK